MINNLSKNLKSGSSFFEDTFAKETLEGLKMKVLTFVGCLFPAKFRWGSSVGPSMNVTPQSYISEIYSANIQALENAMLTILSYIQSADDYHNVVTHMGPDPLQKNPFDESESKLYRNLNTQGANLSKLHALHYERKRKEDLLIYAPRAPYDKPVKQNQAVIDIRGPVTFIQGY